jgi:conjugative transfer signal peptidase TraF
VYVLQICRIRAACARESLLQLPYSCLLWVICLLIIFAALLASSHWIGFNSSASAAPVGFYWRGTVALKRGQLVEVCLPHAWADFSIARGYIGHSARCSDGSEPLGKTILGMPGDTLWIDPATVLKQDMLGRPMPHYFERQHIDKGQIWLFGSARNSFDSRYFGEVPMANVIATLTPLWTWGKP